MQVTGYIDSDPHKWGSFLLGKKISGPMLLAEKKAATIIIASSAVEAITRLSPASGFLKAGLYHCPFSTSF